jgi:hypothetical protein
MMQKLPVFIIFQENLSKPKISQIKTFLFFRFKANGQTLCFFESRFVANPKNLFSCSFLCSSFSIRLYLIKIINIFY